MKHSLFILGVILALALSLRIFYLNKAPIELFGDELDVGYQAYSILKTGRDIRGFKFPVYFHSLSESRAPLFIYAAVPFVAVFGLNEWGVRLPAAFFGLINILLLFWLVDKLFRNRKISLLSAFVLSVIPWHIQYSRVSFEVTLLLSFILAGVVFLFNSLSKKNYLIFSIVSFILSFYVYSTAVLFTPLIVVIFLVIWFSSFRKLSKSFLLASGIFVLVGLFPLFAGMLTGQSQERFSRISIISEQKIIERIITKRGWEGSLGRIFHNKLTEIEKVFISNYFTAFSPQFLFLNGDPNPRHSVGGMGEIFLIFVPFLAWGLFDSVKKINQKENLFLLGWLLVSPIPSALTVDGGNHATRLFLMLPPLAILIAKGINNLFSIKKLIMIPVVVLTSLFFIFNFVSYLHQYYVHYPKESWQYWHFGYKDAVGGLTNIDQNYDKVILNNSHEPMLIRFLFWNKIDPYWFRDNFSDDKPIKNILGEVSGFRVGKYFFVDSIKNEGLSKYLDSKTLYLAFQTDEVPGDWDFWKNPPAFVKTIKVVKNPLGDNYIYLLTGKQ